MKLVIVESPTKTKSLAKYLGSDFTVLATMGHMRDLPKSKMGVEVEENGKVYKFIPGYELVKGKGEQLAKIKKQATKADEVILATDPDREGEAIAFHVAALLTEGKRGGVTEDKLSRVVFHSITKDEVLEAMKNPRKVDMDLVDAQQARRVLDRLVGYKLSPVLWRKVRRGVQSVAVRLVVEKEREIEAFKTDEYWLINVEVEGGSKKDFWIMLAKIEGKKANIKNEQQAKEIEEDLKKGVFVINDVIRKERKLSPKPPFKTSTMQQAAANILGWSAKKTMTIAQKLYEQGNITYHRTDSLNLVPTAISKVREMVFKVYGKEYLSPVPRMYKTSGKLVAQEAHEAIRPTEVTLNPSKFIGQGALAKDQEKLYSLVWKRAVTCQMADALYDSTKVVVEAKNKKNYELTANGEIEKFDGWRKLYKKDKADEVILPEVNTGEKLTEKRVKTEQKFTQPPARYNDASLIKELEKRGIGRPSTYAPTISTILLRHYVEKESGRFKATSIGMAVTDFLMTNFPQQMDYEFTAKMEGQLDEIAGGGLAWQEMLSRFYGDFVEKVSEATGAERIEVPTEKTGRQCPTCKEGEVIIREGRFGKFYSCSKFPECKYTAPLIEYVKGAKCAECGAKVVVRRTRRGKEFYGCEKYPKCKWASWHKPRVEGEEREESVVKE